MKKLLAMFFVICMLAAALVACKGKDEGDGSVVAEDLSVKGSVGLMYELNGDGQGYTLIGIGTCTDSALVIPDTYEGLPITGIGRVAFRYNNSITSVTIGNNVTSIGYEAFRECYRLTALTVSDSVTAISPSAFYGCGGLTSVTIGNSVSNIGTSAFEACDKLVEVINKSSLSVTAGDMGNGYVAYYAKEVHSGESKLVNQSGYMFYTYNGVDYLIGYSGSDTELTLPESYNGQSYKIYDRAFYNYTGRKAVTIPHGITDISHEAFYGCLNIEKATVHSAAVFCIPKDNLKTVVITGGTSIGDFAFCDSDSLENVTIGSSITSIGEWAFNGCSKLANINYGGTVEQWKAITKGYGWNADTNAYTLTCADGALTKAEG